MADTQKGGRGQRIQSLIINASMLAIPLAIYFFFYANLRETQIHERNFRVLDAAASRISLLMDNIPRASQFLSLPGLQLADLLPATTTNAQKQQLDASYRDYFRSTATFGGEQEALRLNAEILRQLDQLEWNTTQRPAAIPGAVYSQADYARERNSIPEAPLFSARLVSPVVGPTMFSPLLLNPEAMRKNVPVVTTCKNADEPVISRITRQQRQVLTYDLCQPPVIVDQLTGDGELQNFLNYFMLQMEIPISELVKGVLPLLSTSFDDVLILNQAGTVLYRAGNDTDTDVFDTPLVGNDEIGQVSESFVAFESFDLASPQAGDAPATGRFATARDNADASVGEHSRRVQFTIGGLALVAYAHPFAVGNVVAGSEEESVWYIVGITTRKAITSASTELRLRTINLTMLVIATLISAFIFIWLRTNGKRALLLPHHLLITVLSGAVALSLTVLLAHLVYRDIIYRQQGEREIREVAEKLTDSFNREVIDKACYLNVILHGTDSCESRSMQLPTREFPPFEVMLQLDAEGRAQTVNATAGAAAPTTILSNRVYKVPAANLAFRRYFLEPRAGHLYGFADASRSRELYLERITSVLDGTVETVISAPAKLVDPTHVGDDVIAAIIHLDSLDDAVLPHPYRFAVIDSESGMTLYHSLKERSLVTNFLQDVAPNETLMEALRWQQTRALDLVYAGNPVTARVQPLATGLPWTLVVYRDHETRDTADTIATICTIGVAGFIGLMLMLIGAVLPSLSRLVIDALWTFCRASGKDALRRTNVALLAAIVVYLVLLLASLPAWITAPLCIITAATILFTHSQAVGAVRHASRADDSRFGPLSGQKLFLSAILILFFVLPAMQLFSHFTRAIDDQLLAYRNKETVSALIRRCDNLQTLVNRYDAAIGPGAMGQYLAPTDRYGLIAPEGMTLSCALPAPVFNSVEATSLTTAFLGALGNFSSTASAITARISQTDQAALTTGNPQFELPALMSLPRLLAALLVVLAALFFVVSTLTARILYTGLRPHRLPQWTHSDLKLNGERPWHLIIDLTRVGFDAFVAHCREQRIAIQQMCKCGDAEVEWKALYTPAGALPQHTVYVVREIEYFANREIAVCALLHEALRKKQPLLVFTRVIPAHWLKSRADDTGEKKHRLLRILADFENFQAVSPQNCFAAELLSLAGQVYDASDRTQAWLAHEADCFPELCASIVRVYLDAQGQQYKDRDYLEAIKLSCGIYFRRLWEISSHEEQLQLYALSRHGFVNPSLRSAISSLSARRLVDVDGRTTMRSRAFAHFIARELDHEDLNKWIREDRQRLWTLVWQPISIIAALGLAFVFVSTPDRLNSITAILVSAVGAMPILTSLMSGLRTAATSGSGSEKTG